MNWPLFISTFSLIFIAELPDKTAFATVLLAARGRPAAIFTGVASAFVVQTIVAVTFGKLIGMLPDKWVHLGAGILFLLFAAHTWLHKDDSETSDRAESARVSGRTKFFKSAWKAFMVIFIAEWGDLTQLATASIAARYHDFLLTIFCAATLALWAVTVIAVFVGHKAKHLLPTSILKKTSTLIFAGVGLYFIWTWIS